MSWTGALNMVDAMIENMRAQRPVFTAVERPARTGDRVLLDYQARIGGKPFEGAELSDVRIVLGARQAMPELEQGLLGVGAGEQRTISVVFPQTHPNKQIAGQAADLHLSIKAVEEPSLPEVDEEFFRAYGVETGGLTEMRTEVRTSMERELNEVVRGRLRTQVLEALYRDNPLDLPQGLIDEQVQQLQLDTARVIGGVRSPVLVIHGARDQIIPLAMGQAVFAAAPQPKRLWVAPDAGHIDLVEAGAIEAAAEFVSEITASASANP